MTAVGLQPGPGPGTGPGTGPDAGAVKAVEAPRWVDFPGPAQVVQVRRSRTVKGREASSRSVEVVYLM